MPSMRCTAHNETLWPIQPAFRICPEPGCGLPMGRVGPSPNATESEINQGRFVDWLRRNGRLDEAA